MLDATNFESAMSTNSITLALCMVINVELMLGIIAMQRAYTTTFYAFYDQVPKDCSKAYSAFAISLLFNKTWSLPTLKCPINRY